MAALQLGGKIRRREPIAQVFNDGGACNGLLFVTVKGLRQFLGNPITEISASGRTSLDA